MKGRLFLAVGNSASGKDSVISYALRGIPTLKKLKRVITRPESDTEDFISIKKEDFKAEDYFISWESYNKFYGIPKNILDGLEKGEDYIVNVSRQVITEIKNKWNNTFVILFQVPIEILKQRLSNRGREDNKEIKQRLERASDAPRIKADLIIDSSNPDVSIAGEELIKFIKLQK